MEFLPHEKLILNTDRLDAFARGDDFAPALVEISPSNDCPAKCPWCWFVSAAYKQKHSKEELPFDVLERCLTDLKIMGVPAVTWTGGGDPCAYTRIDDAVDCAHDLGLKQGMFSNCYRPIRAPEKLAWLRVTVTEKFVITKHVAGYAQKTKVGVNFNLCRENEQHLRPMVHAARDAGVAYFQVRPALADRWDLQQQVDLPSWLLQYATPQFRVVLTPYKFEDYMRPHGYPVCHGHRFVPFIWHSGDVSVCAYHFGKEPFVFGNLNEESFPQIWAGERRREMLARGVDVVTDCQHACKNHMINKTLAMIKREALVPDDPEFI